MEASVIERIHSYCSCKLKDDLYEGVVSKLLMFLVYFSFWNEALFNVALSK